MIIEHNGQYFEIEYSETRNEVVATIDGFINVVFDKKGLSDEILTLKIEMAPFDEVQEAYHAQFGDQLLKLL